jgi:hypothetical protein
MGAIERKSIEKDREEMKAIEEKTIKLVEK